MITIARYARLSKKNKRDEDKTASIERQLADAERFIQANNLGNASAADVYAEPIGTSCLARQAARWSLASARLGCDVRGGARGEVQGGGDDDPGPRLPRDVPG